MKKLYSKLKINKAKIKRNFYIEYPSPLHFTEKLASNQIRNHTTFQPMNQTYLPTRTRKNDYQSFHNVLTIEKVHFAKDANRSGHDVPSGMFVPFTSQQTFANPRKTCPEFFPRTSRAAAL
jgi:hypothetical protein